jgi:hypothetical protein
MGACVVIKKARMSPLRYSSPTLFVDGLICHPRDLNDAGKHRVPDKTYKNIELAGIRKGLLVEVFGVSLATNRGKDMGISTLKQ